MSKKKIIIYWIPGLLLSLLAWPPAPLSNLIFICYVPFIVLSIRIKEQKKLIGTLYSFYYILILIKTTGLLSEGHFTNGLVLAMFVLPILWMLPFLILNYLTKKGMMLVGLVAFPFLYLLNEYWQYFWDLSFIAYHLSFSVGESWLMNPIYPISGVLGMSFLIISVNTALALLENKVESRKFGIIYVGLAILLSFSSLIPLNDEAPGDPENQLEIAVFSPRSEDTKRLTDDFAGQFAFLHKSIQDADLENVDLLVGPEAYLNDLEDNPIFTNNIDENTYIKELKKVCVEKDISLLIGAILVELIPSKNFPSSSAKIKEKGLYYEIYNGSILISPSNKTQWRTKQILLPFVEKIPFHPIINTLSESFPFIPRLNNTYGVKDDIRPYIINGKKIVNSICYEGLYPLQLEERMQAQGADIQIILSNDWTIDEKTVDQYETYCHAVGKGCNISTLLVNMNEKSVFLDKNGNIQRYDGYPISRIK